MKSLVCVFLLLVLVEVMHCEGCWKQERDALIALSWVDTSTDCCEWDGVECNTTTGRVTKLKPPYFYPGSLNYSDFAIFKDLKNLDLSESEISNCTRTHQGLNNLEVLDLSENEFDMISILSCLDGLSSLKSLSLGYMYYMTQFHDFQTILETIPSKLLHLEVLDIGNNDLSNEILPSLRGFTSLKELHLSDIGLDSDLHIPGLCAVLKNLEILDISNNNFNETDIASALSGLSSLKSLVLAASEITLRSIHNISKLRSLEILDLSANNFNETDIASALSGLSSLKSLDLAASELTLRSIHNISKLKTLEILDLSANYLNSWPLENHGLSNNIISSLNGLPRLKSLDLSTNNLNGSLDINGLSNLTSLKIIDFSHNQIVDLVVHEENHGFRFAWPSSLQVLSLRGNSLSNKILSQLSGLPHLKSLDLSHNNLNGSLDITGLSTLTSLKILDFSNNQLIDLVVHKGSKNLSRLDILNLNFNMINGSNLQEWLPAFPSIKHLTLRYNEFKGSILDGGFRGLSNLEYLALEGSYNLKSEFFKSIGDLPSLKVLSVWRCGINGTLPIGDWSKLKKLEELDLSYNDFMGKLPSSFVNMTSLRTLTLTNNHFIGNIGPNLASFTSLEYLIFEGNQFEFPISFTQFSNHSNLKFIYGNGNKVILDSHSTLKTWIPKFQLQVLQLSSITHAKSIPLPNFLIHQYNLTYVDFTSCKLRGEFSKLVIRKQHKNGKSYSSKLFLCRKFPSSIPSSSQLGNN